MGACILVSSNSELINNLGDKNTLLLLHGDSLVSDSISYPRVAIQNSTSVNNPNVTLFGKNSFYFDSGIGLQIKLPANALDGDHTIEWWEYDTTSSQGCIFTSVGQDYGHMYASGYIFGYLGTQTYVGTDYSTNNWNLLSNVNMHSVTVNKWVHWAFVRQGSSFKSYRNGILYAETSFNGIPAYGNDNNNYYIGIGYWYYWEGKRDGFNGYMKEFRVSNIARYTANFIVPSGPFKKGL